jgi:hypothetical protein
VDTRNFPETADDFHKISEEFRGEKKSGKKMAGMYDFRLTQGDNVSGKNLRVDLMKILFATVAHPQFTIGTTFETSMIVGSSADEWSAGVPSALFQSLEKDSTIEDVPKRPIKPPNSWYSTHMSWWFV